MIDDNNPITDDLDTFSNELFGISTEKEVEKPVEIEEDHPGEVEPAPTETNEDVDPDADVLDEEDETPPEDPNKLKIKKKQTFQERINELTAKAREAERRELELQRKLEETIARLDGKKEEPRETAKVFDGPQPDDLTEDGEAKYALGEFDPQYIRDLTKFTLDQETKAYREQQEQKAREEALKAEQTALQTQWENKLAEAEKELPDLREKGQNLVSTFESIDEGYGQYLANTLMSLDNGPEILYYLSSNPEEASAIVASGPVLATLALGRLDAKFVKQASPSKKVSDAPEPPPVRARGAGGRFDVPDDTDDLAAFERKLFTK